MIKIKRFLAIVCFASLLLNAFACSSKNEVKNEASTVASNETKESSNKKQIKVVSTIFPIYDIVRNVVPNDNYEMTLLLDSGIDIHNFSPTAKDIVKIAEADLFIYVGGESDKWVDKVVTTAQNKNLKTVNLMDELGNLVKEEEIVEGMQDEEHEHEEGEVHEEGNHEEHENDEHIWLSLKNAKVMTSAIAAKVIEIDSEHQAEIQKNANLFIEKLDALDKKYLEVAENKKYDTVVFGDRFPFRYLVDDYGLKYFAAFSGCSAEAEASFETVVFLSKKLDELRLKHICALKGAEPKVARTVINASDNKNREIVLFNSMEGITNVNDAENTNYLKIMEENLEAFKNAIN